MKIYEMSDTQETHKIQSVKKGFLEEAPEKNSAMRAMSLIALLASIIFGIITICSPGVNQENGMFITAFFLLAAFAPKTLQKFAETKYPSSKN